MTIFKANIIEKKDDADFHQSEVVSDSLLLIENEKNEARVDVTNDKGFRRPHTCLAFILVPLTLILFIALIWVLQHVQHQQEVEYVGRCGVEFVQREGNEDRMLPLFGQFEQEVLISGQIERIGMPHIGNANQATILHDFNTNWTVIVDKEMGYCFIISLDRSLVMPPTNFFDLLLKLKSGYFLVDAEVLRASYKAITPPVEDFTVYGSHIASECANYQTFKLAKHGEPVALSKRSTCKFAGEKYCLGDAGYDKMLCLRITGCF